LYKERLPYDYEVSKLPYGNEISNETGKWSEYPPRYFDPA
jgi:hypothetical protein